MQSAGTSVEREKPSGMFDADIVVCGECGNVHMQGGAGAESVESCAVCDGAVSEVKVGEIMGF
jgi:hypothetical protein